MDDNEEVAIIMEPVTDGGTLPDYLLRLRDDKAFRVEKFYTAQRFYGNLLHTLAEIYSISKVSIRHKDINPCNILFHNDQVMLADFGLALDCKAYEQSTTEGYVAALNHIFSAPEVIGQERRNKMSDIFSLGAVFFEIMAALRPTDESLNKFSNYYGATNSVTYAEKAAEIRLYFRNDRRDIVQVICLMLNTNSSHRWTANELYSFSRPEREIQQTS